MAEGVAVCFNGETRRVPADARTTFFELRQAAAQLWSLQPEQSQLRDADGCSWPLGDRVAEWAAGLPDGRVHLHVPLFDEDSGSGGGGVGGVSDAARAGEALELLGAKAREAARPSLAAVAAAELKGSQAEAKGAAATAALPEGASLQGELWAVFTHACVNGPYGVDCLSMQQLVRLLRGCGVVGARLSRAEADIVYTQECRKPLRMSFEDFLAALVELAARAFGAADGSREARAAALFRLLHAHLLPAAPRLRGDALGAEIASAAVAGALAGVGAFVDAAFGFYSGGAAHLSFAGFARFAKDFRVAAAGLTHAELGRAFLASKTPPADGDWVRHPHRTQLSAAEFRGALARCAAAVFGAASAAPLSDKVKALFLFMVQRSALQPREGQHRDPLSALVALLHAQVIALWDADGRRDYLNEASLPSLSERAAATARAAALASAPASADEDAAAALQRRTEALVRALEDEAMRAPPPPPVTLASPVPAIVTVKAAAAAQTARGKPAARPGVTRGAIARYLLPTAQTVARVAATQASRRAASPLRAAATEGARAEETRADAADAAAAAGERRRPPRPQEYVSEAAAAAALPASPSLVDAVNAEVAEARALLAALESGAQQQTTAREEAAEEAKREEKASGAGEEDGAASAATREAESEGARAAAAPEAASSRAPSPAPDARLSTEDAPSLAAANAAAAAASPPAARTHEEEAEAARARWRAEEAARLRREVTEEVTRAFAAERKSLDEEGRRLELARQASLLARAGADDGGGGGGGGDSEGEGEAALRATLQRGDYFVKFCAWGKPKTRFVALSEDGARLLWGETSDRVRKLSLKNKGKSIAVADIIELRRGFSGPQMQKKASAETRARDGAKGLVVTARDRCLELVASSPAVAARWAEAMARVLRVPVRGDA